MRNFFALQYKQKIARFLGVFGINTGSWYFKTPQISLAVAARDILVNFEIPLAVLIPNIPRNRAISYTNTSPQGLERPLLREIRCINGMPFPSLSDQGGVCSQICFNLVLFLCSRNLFWKLFFGYWMPISNTREHEEMKPTFHM